MAVSHADNKDKLFGDVHIPLNLMIKRLLKYLKPEWHRFLFSFLLILLTVGVDIILPLFMNLSFQAQYYFCVLYHRILRFL